MDGIAGRRTLTVLYESEEIRQRMDALRLMGNTVQLVLLDREEDAHAC